jgi:AcrR family transcriptional regulator
MARPSRGIDLALLQSGRELLPVTGCDGLSLRQLADHAGVNLGMFHYHFKTKDNFLRTLLQQMYEEMFAGLAEDASQAGPALTRLRAALERLARFVRTHRKLIGRVWSDAVNGVPVAREFLRANAPRHFALLMRLMGQAQAEGAIDARAPLPRFVFLMGSVVAPMLIVPGVVDIGIDSDIGVGKRQIDDLVLSDAAIAQRVDLALSALGVQPTIHLPSKGRRHV